MLYKSLLKTTKFSQIKRREFAQLNEQDICFFKKIVSNRIITDLYELQPFNVCWRKINYGNSKLVILPKNSGEVSQILKYCNQRNLAVVPQGGNTGLVGGSVPVYDEIIINMKNMNHISSFDYISSVLNCQAGCILDNLNQYLLSYGSEVPLDLGAKGSCHIGGNAATNAGGKYVIKYGSFRANILGLQVVTPDGTILNLQSSIHKDNTGYDLKQLFIGSQGTLGIITKLNINCKKIDQNRKIVVFKSNSYESILDSVPLLKNIGGKNLNAMQYMDGYTYLTVTKFLHPQIFEKVNVEDHLLFVELTTDDIESIVQALPNFEDAIMSTNEQQFIKIWKIREDAAVAAAKQGKVMAYDISFNVKKWPMILKEIRQDTQAWVMGYGHIGDGNLHVSVCLQSMQQMNDQTVFKKVVREKGSISAQHGIGRYKSNFLHLQKSPATLALYQNIKNMFDPKSIMNPYKILL